MHAKHKFHRDLKPLNIFLSGDLTRPSTVNAKLGDFGLVKDVDHSMNTQVSMKGTMNYFSPEMMTQEGGGLPSDLWVLGAILHQLLAGGYPFASHADLMRGKFRNLPDWTPLGLKKLVAGLLTVDP